MLQNTHSQSGKDTYHRFADFLNEASGIVLGDNKEYLVRCRLSKIIESEGFSDLEALVYKLEQPSTSRVLKEKVVDAMTTNETFWFRDVHPFDALRRHILPSVKENLKIGEPVQIWSAACSSGQEPYTISMTSQEFIDANPRHLPAGVQVVATDISPSMLQQARQACYDELSLSRGLSLQRREKYFEPVPNESKMKLKDSIARRVHFKPLNLLDNFTFPQKFHCIFCRNVLIYFSPEIKKEILSKLYQCLTPNGYLILGGTESIGHQNYDFEMIKVSGAIVYKKKAH